MKAMASDFDGTLFFHTGLDKIRSCDVEAIQRFQEEGNLFGICTGRPLHAIREATQNRIRYDFYIVSSGAVILDSNCQILYEQCLSQQLSEALYARYHTCCEVVVQADHKVFAFQSPAHMPVQQEIVASLRDIAGFHVYGVSMKAEDEQRAAHICREIQQLYGEEAAAYQNMNYVDVVKKGCSKGQAMDWLKQFMHIPFLGGIGDSYNDAPLLQHADAAFTFHHSPTQIQQLSNHLVSSVAEAIQIMTTMDAA